MTLLQLAYRPHPARHPPPRRLRQPQPAIQPNCPAATRAAAHIARRSARSQR